MTGRTLYFDGPRSVSVEETPVPDPGPDEVLVRTTRSAISPGTELLVYRDEVPEQMATDETIDALDGTLSYPLRYGYAAVGEVAALGREVDEEWRGRQVFAFHPHESHFLARTDELVPTTLPPETATLIANAEAAVSFVMDGRPRIGERVAVYGQGPVGLLTTALLAAFPLDRLVAVDCFERRRDLARDLGADVALAPDEDVPGAIGGDGADLAIELSGTPAALDDAIGATGFAGQVLVGSWYGTKAATLDLGGAYHRSHIRIRSSQVSRVDPDHADRWDKDRRLGLVRDRLAELSVDDLFTHTFTLEAATDAYRLLDERKAEAVQVLFRYD
ncbi:MAG TPA: zinc-binding dehydrogenase [Natrialbaceae archaeon]|nr:zinc-binding dehydrogenase [Natrialbaceae archaeon]